MFLDLSEIVVVFQFPFIHSCNFFYLKSATTMPKIRGFQLFMFCAFENALAPVNK